MQMKTKALTNAGNTPKITNFFQLKILEFCEGIIVAELYIKTIFACKIDPKEDFFVFIILLKYITETLNLQWCLLFLGVIPTLTQHIISVALPGIYQLCV